MSSTTCGSDVAANTLFDNLVDATDFVLPEIDLTDPQFQIPDTSNNAVYETTDKLTEAALTERKVGGTGMFDALMEANKRHLHEEYAAGRISSAMYSETYVAMTTAVMGAAVQYLLQKDNAYYQSLLVQKQAEAAEVGVVQAKVQLEGAKAELVRQRVLVKTASAQSAHTKLMIATEDAKRCLTEAQSTQVKYETEFVMPKQVEKLTADIAVTDLQGLGIVAQTAQTEYQTNNILPKQVEKLTADVAVTEYQVSDILPAEKAAITARTGVSEAQAAQAIYETDFVLPKQVETATAQISKLTADKDQVLYQTSAILPAQLAGIQADTNNKVYTHENLLPAQVANTTVDTEIKDFTHTFIQPVQKDNLIEQWEANRAQTTDTRSDGSLVHGSIGKQKELHSQQIESYQRDQEWKVAKGLIDVWITTKSLDEGTLTPSSLNEGAINSVMGNVRSNLGI